MQTVNVTEFRQHLPSYLKQVAAGEEIHITSHGKAIARLLPAEDPSVAARAWLEALRGVGSVGDVISPIDEVEWTGDADNL
jgi:prevent-host-death family protein